MDGVVVEYAENSAFNNTRAGVVLKMMIKHQRTNVPLDMVYTVRLRAITKYQLGAQRPQQASDKIYDRADIPSL